MENISCHSNQSFYPTGIENTFYVEANVLSMYAKFQLHPPYEFLEEDFDFFSLENLPFMSSRQPFKFSDLDKRHIKLGGLLNKRICENKIQISPMRQQKLSIFTFPIISLWKL